MSTNPQRPFAYLPKPKKNPVVPLNVKWAYFPSNYVAMCITCLFPYQKVEKLCGICKVTPVEKQVQIVERENIVHVCCSRCNRRLTCTRCTSSSIKRFTPNLLPWILLPPGLPRVYGFNNYLEANTTFHCGVCGAGYASLAIYSTLCSCEEHSAKSHHFTCRYCCQHTSEKLLRAISKARENLDKDVSRPLKVSPLHIRHLPTNIFRHNVVRLEELYTTDAFTFDVDVDNED